MGKSPRFTLLFVYNPQKISPQPYYTENLGIQYIGAVLRQAGYNVQIINADYEDLSGAQLTRLIREFGTTFLGMAPCYITMQQTLAIASEVRSDGNNTLICLGGHHATFCADDILKNEQCIDFIIRGEGEQTIVELARAIESSNGQMPPTNALLAIDGLSFRVGEQISHNKDRTLVEDLDSLPFPVRDPLDRVLDADEHAMPLLCTSRGCPANCSFCSTPQFYHRTWRARSAENVANEIESIVNVYGFTQFYLTDDQFAGKGELGKLHVKSIIDEIKRRQLHMRFNLHFFLMIRADFFRKSNEDIIKEFEDVGFRDIFIGFESADYNQLRLYRKGGQLAQYQEAMQILRHHNIFLEGGFIIFNPYSTFDSLRQDAEFIRQLGVPLFGYHTKELMAFPGTHLFGRLVQDSMMPHHSYKRIEIRYRDDRIGELHRYLRDFFEDFEVSDNQVFECIDFRVKLQGMVRRIRDQKERERAGSFIRRTETTFREITTLNHKFFNQVLDIFDKGGRASQCRALQQTFCAQHSRLTEPIIREYVEFNNRIGIIRKTQTDGKLISKWSARDEG